VAPELLTLGELELERSVQELEEVRELSHDQIFLPGLRSPFGSKTRLISAWSAAARSPH
jgi:hypothetical protein